ncbi:IS1096 element passenger TnpR family protein [Thermus filiformis]|uniref:Plasmid pRiA4b Orf3-like domain-containing protein n=1 Tax=Thermus filiformis TaxID=276 RepID=A0A0D6XD48_THEFI|nr:hypothetical protein [Thermus filiformis]KIX84813.1 hypothetical protein THFILI_00575 [Thermus filiformis]
MPIRSRVPSYGKCFLCGGTFAKNVIGRHLKKCAPAHDPGKGKPVRLFHLAVEGRHAPDYWMHLEMPASATLAHLDDFLRAVWLECCGHLSVFIIGGVAYELDTGMVDAMWKHIFGSPYSTRSMDIKLQQVLSVGETFTYEYDFGTTTELKLKVAGERQGARPAKGVRVLARNYAPVIPCVRCGRPAHWVHVWGDYETYCGAHAQEEEDWEEGFLPLVNSPRVGMCAYTGPDAEELRFEETAPEKA